MHTCDAALERVARGEIEAWTDTEVLQEIVYHSSAIGELKGGLHLARLAVDQVGGEVYGGAILSLLPKYGQELVFNRCQGLCRAFPGHRERLSLAVLSP